MDASSCFFRFPAALLVLAVLHGCGSEPESTDDDSIRIRPNDPPIAETVFTSFVGVWDSSVDEIVDGALVHDEIYIVIFPDGSAKEYDYRGDGFDQGLNCYNTTDYSLTVNSSGRLEISPGYFSGSDTPDTLRYLEATDVLVLDFQTIDDESDESMWTRASHLLESDLVPLCQVS